MRMVAVHGTAQPGVWTHDEVERRLRDAITTLRRMPMPVNGMPAGAAAMWPEYAYNMADRAGWIIGAGTPEYLRRNESERNRTRLHATRDQIKEMDEVLIEWRDMVRDRRQWKVIFARSHVWPGSDRPMHSYRKIARDMGMSHEKVRQLYRKGIKRIAMKLSFGPTER